MQKGIYYIFILALLYACATPIPPSGGNKDIQAPVLLLSMPQNEMINYQGNEIVLKFDEYFTFLSSLDKILITPAMPNLPKFSVKGKNLHIRLPEGLAENTTYSITFMDAIKDFNEGNALEYYKYVFSTGDYIDSFSVSGKVIDVFDGKGFKNATVGLYQLDVQASLQTSKPLYVAKTNETGSFVLENIKGGEYFIFALNDKNLNYIFDQSTEEVSLPSEGILINDKIVLEEDIVLFSTYMNASIESYNLLGNNSLNIIFNQEIVSIYIDLKESSDQDLAYFGKFQDTLFYSWADTLVKELNFSILINDSIQDSLMISLGKNKINKSLQVASLYEDELIIACPFNIANLDKEGISLLDSMGNSIVFEALHDANRVIIKGSFVIGMFYDLEVLSSAITYFNGSKANYLRRLDLEVLERVDYSNLNLTYTSKYAENLMLELYKEDKKILVKEMSNGLLNIDDLPPGTYNIRIFEDLNQDGKWTTGSFDLGRPAERVVFYSSPIEMKANWDKDLNVSF